MNIMKIDRASSSKVVYGKVVALLKVFLEIGVYLNVIFNKNFIDYKGSYFWSILIYIYNNFFHG